MRILMKITNNINQYINPKNYSIVRAKNTNSTQNSPFCDLTSFV